MREIIIIGGGGHASSLADSIESTKLFHIAGYTDIKQNVNNKYKYLGDDSNLHEIFNDGIKYAACGVGYLGQGNIRDKIYNTLKAIGFTMPAIIDPSARIAGSVQIGEGSFIAKGVIVNANAFIGRMCIINSGAIIEHDNFINDYAHVSIGVNLCGNVTIGSHAFIGAGSTILQGVSIGMNTIIGASSLVLSNTASGVKKFGVIKS